jgi:hypothetical protein
MDDAAPDRRAFIRDLASALAGAAAFADDTLQDG